MLLDEVTSALDPELVGEVLAAVRDLKSEGVTMMLATHEMGFAREVADVVCFLHEGRLLEIGPPEQVLELRRSRRPSGSYGACSRPGGHDLRVARYGREVKTLGAVAREFAPKWSPRMLAVAIAAALAVRIAIGDYGWPDVAAVAMLVVYPFGEWAIRALPAPPASVRVSRAPRRPPYGPRPSRAPRAAERPDHDPAGPDRAGRALLLLAVPATVAVGSLIVTLVAGRCRSAPWSPRLTGYVAVGIYEWTHFIHTAHRPRPRYYRTIWRNHRLHHFKNERYWHGITQNLSDRVLRTNPDQRTVRRSRTARHLDPGPSR